MAPQPKVPISALKHRRAILESSTEAEGPFWHIYRAAQFQGPFFWTISASQTLPNILWGIKNKSLKEMVDKTSLRFVRDTIYKTTFVRVYCFSLDAVNHAIGVVYGTVVID